MRMTRLVGDGVFADFPHFGEACGGEGCGKGAEGWEWPARLTMMLLLRVSHVPVRRVGGGREGRQEIEASVWERQVVKQAKHFVMCKVAPGVACREEEEEWRGAREVRMRLFVSTFFVVKPSFLYVLTDFVAKAARGGEEGRQR